MLAVDPAVHGALRAALALLLLSSAGHKLHDFSAFRNAVAGYGLVPSRWLTVAALLLVGLELGTGVSLVAPGLGGGPAYAAAALLATYTGAIAIALQRGGRGIDCGCAGTAGGVPLGRGLIIRNFGLMGLALGAALPTAARSMTWLDAFTMAATLGTLMLLYASADHALANAARLRALTRPHIIDDAAGVPEGGEWSTP